MERCAYCGDWINPKVMSTEAYEFHYNASCMEDRQAPDTNDSSQFPAEGSDYE